LRWAAVNFGKSRDLGSYFWSNLAAGLGFPLGKNFGGFGVPLRKGGFPIGGVLFGGSGGLSWRFTPLVTFGLVFGTKNRGFDKNLTAPESRTTLPAPVRASAFATAAAIGRIGIAVGFFAIPYRQNRYPTCIQLVSLCNEVVH